MLQQQPSNALDFAWRGASSPQAVRSVQAEVTEVASQCARQAQRHSSQ